MSETDRPSGPFRLQPDQESDSVTLTTEAWPGLRLAGLAPALTVGGTAHLPTSLTVTAGPSLTWTFAGAGLVLEQRPTHIEGGMRLESRLSNLAEGERVLNQVTLLATGRAQLGS
ncbi:MAG: hypothetical protein GXX94_11350, partial [Chloroflexi bacterium]|nr:hypothetical protein [Chloroflexota bacterium]